MTNQRQKRLRSSPADNNIPNQQKSLLELTILTNQQEFQIMKLYDIAQKAEKQLEEFTDMHEEDVYNLTSTISDLELQNKKLNNQLNSQKIEISQLKEKCSSLKAKNNKSKSKKIMDTKNNQNYTSIDVQCEDFRMNLNLQKPENILSISNDNAKDVKRNNIINSMKIQLNQIIVSKDEIKNEINDNFTVLMKDLKRLKFDMQSSKARNYEIIGNIDIFDIEPSDPDLNSNFPNSKSDEFPEIAPNDIPLKIENLSYFIYQRQSNAQNIGKPNLIQPGNQANEAEITNLINDNENLNALISKLKEEIENYKTKISILFQENNDLKLNNEKFNQENSNLKYQLETIQQSSLNKIEEQLQVTQQENEGLCKQISILNRKNTDLISENSKLNLLVDDIKWQNIEFLEKYESAQKSLDSIQKLVIQEKHEYIDKFIRFIKNIDSFQNNFNQKFEEQKYKANSLKSENNESPIRAKNTVSKKIEQFKRDIDQLKSENHTLKQENNEVGEKLAVLNNEIAQITEMNNSYRIIINELSGANEQLKLKNQDLENQITELYSSLHFKHEQSEIPNLLDCQNIKDQNDSLILENIQLKKDNNNFQDKIVQYEEMLTNIKNENQKLENKITELKNIKSANAQLLEENQQLKQKNLEISLRLSNMSDNYQQQMSELSKKTSNQNLIIGELNEEIRNHIQKIADQTQIIYTYEEKTSHLNELLIKMRSLEEEKSDINNKLTIYGDQINDTSEKNRKLKKELEEISQKHSKELKQFRAQNKRYKQLLEENQKYIKEQELQNRKYLGEKDVEIKNLLDEVNQNTENISSLRIIIQKMHDEKRIALKPIECFHFEQYYINKEYSEIEEDVFNLNKDNAAFKRQMSQLQEKLKAIIQEKADLIISNEKLKQQVESVPIVNTKEINVKIKKLMRKNLKWKTKYNEEILKCQRKDQEIEQINSQIEIKNIEIKKKDKLISTYMRQFQNMKNHEFLKENSNNIEKLLHQKDNEIAQLMSKIEEGQNQILSMTHHISSIKNQIANTHEIEMNQVKYEAEKQINKMKKKINLLVSNFERIPNFEISSPNSIQTYLIHTALDDEISMYKLQIKELELKLKKYTRENQILINQLNEMQNNPEHKDNSTLKESEIKLENHASDSISNMKETYMQQIADLEAMLNIQKNVYDSIIINMAKIKRKLQDKLNSYENILLPKHTYGIQKFDVYSKGKSEHEIKLQYLKRTLIQFFTLDNAEKSNMLPVILELVGCNSQQIDAIKLVWEKSRSFISRL